MEHNENIHTQIHSKETIPVNNGVYRLPDYDDADGFAFAKFENGNWHYVNWSRLCAEPIVEASKQSFVRHDLTRNGVRWFGLR